MRMFAFRGRADRREYILHIALETIAYIFLLFFIDLTETNRSEFESTGIGYAVVVICIMIAIIIDHIGIILRRLEDLGRPRYHYWLLLIPLYNIYLEIILLTRRGISGPLVESKSSPQTMMHAPGDDENSEYICSRCNFPIKWGDPYCPSCGDVLEY